MFKLLEIINLVNTVIMVYLFSINNKYGWLLSMFSCLLFAFIYYNNGLLFQFGVQFIFMFQAIVAFFFTKINNKQNYWIYVFYFIIPISLILFIDHEPDKMSLVYYDSFLMLLALVANQMLIHKKDDAWYVWLLFDILSMLLCIHLHLYITFILYIVLSIISIKTIIINHNKQFN